MDSKPIALEFESLLTRMENLDWRDMFKRYIDIVGEAEGVSFLYKYQWSLEEWIAIDQLLSES